MFEGIARIEADAYRLLASLGASPVTEVVSAGGGAVNPKWTDIRSRAIGVPVRAAAQGEGGDHEGLQLKVRGKIMRGLFSTGFKGMIKLFEDESLSLKIICGLNLPIRRRLVRSGSSSKKKISELNTVCAFLCNQ